MKEPGSEDSQYSLSHPANEHYAIIESENKQLRKELAECKTSCSAYEVSLAESKAWYADAVATLFRLRPQREECTETEIEENFDALLHSIQSWVERNCSDFLDNDHQGFEIMLNRGIGGNPRVETILKRFQLNTKDLVEFKDRILEAIVMRHLFDGILNQSWPILLKEGEEDLLTRIYESLATTDPPKGNLPYPGYLYDDANGSLVARFTYDAHLEK
jgi:hypothetical protein